ncbi:MAG: transketolase C-terminal domain-containing protein, partial [Burkholderiaceae bacterium]|nr:transketolase C-terminal domain-containing protein [Burkholderiaceae bacterium]
SVLDLRWLSPLDEESLAQVVKRAAGRVLIVHEAVRTGGFGGEVAMRISERLGAEMPLQISRLTTPDVRIPAAPHLQAALIPNAQSIVQEVQRLLKKAVGAGAP